MNIRYFRNQSRDFARLYEEDGAYHIDVAYSTDRLRKNVFKSNTPDVCEARLTRNEYFELSNPDIAKNRFSALEQPALQPGLSK